MYIQKLNMDLLLYKKRINSFDVFDYTKELPYTISCSKLEDKVGKELVKKYIRYLTDPYCYEDFEPTCILSERLSKGSLSEKIFATILWLNNIPFQYERKLEGSKHRFDFYIDVEGYPIVIEINGAQHYERGSSEYKKRMFEETIVSDSIKSEYCQERGIPLFFVDTSKPSFEFILDSVYWYEDLRFLVDIIDKKELIEIYSEIFGYPY